MTSDFYKQSEIFVTGGSGVVGKAAIDKLLRSCDVKYIYVLLRCKKGISSESRLEDLKSSSIFKVLKEQKPNELDKLVVIPGDTTLAGLGISSQNKKLLKNVSVIIHSAASTRFDEPLRQAIKLNLKSTLEALQLAETFNNLKIFLHVSTFFCNPFVDHLEDKVYPGIFDWKVALKILDSENKEIDSALAAVTDKVIAGFPNTYVFTKHLSEQLVNDHRSKLPVAIFRPSIVVNALEEPEPGFTETLTGVMGLFTIWGTGLLQVLLCRRNSVLDCTPLDMNSKFMLSFIAKTARLEKERFMEKTPVGMFSSRRILKHNFLEVGNFLTSLSRDLPFEKSFWIPHVTLTECPFIYSIYNFFLQLLPAFIVDLFLMLIGQKPILMKLQRKIFYTAQALRFFISNEFTSAGATDYEELLVKNRGTEFDIAVLENSCINDTSMRSVLESITAGCRKFLLKEDESTLPRCRNILKAKLFAYYVLRIYVLYVVGSAIYRRVINYIGF